MKKRYIALIIVFIFIILIRLLFVYGVRNTTFMELHNSKKKRVVTLDNIKFTVPKGFVKQRTNRYEYSYKNSKVISYYFGKYSSSEIYIVSVNSKDWKSNSFEEYIMNSTNARNSDTTYNILKSSMELVNKDYWYCDYDEEHPYKKEYIYYSGNKKDNYIIYIVNYSEENKKSINKILSSVTFTKKISNNINQKDIDNKESNYKKAMEEKESFNYKYDTLEYIIPKNYKLRAKLDSLEIYEKDYKNYHNIKIKKVDLTNNSLDSFFKAVHKYYYCENGDLDEDLSIIEINNKKWYVDIDKYDDKYKHDIYYYYSGDLTNNYMIEFYYDYSKEINSINEQFLNSIKINS